MPREILGGTSDILVIDTLCFLLSLLLLLLCFDQLRKRARYAKKMNNHSNTLKTSNEEGKGIDKKDNEKLVYVWGYLPGATPDRIPITSPVRVEIPDSDVLGDSRWKDVCGGGCGFAIAISESGKLMTWGSADDQGLSYLTSGKHGEAPEYFPLPTEVPILKTAAGWAHCASVLDTGEVYAWGWNECVPSGNGKVIQELTTSTLGNNKDAEHLSVGIVAEQASPKFQGSKLNDGRTMVLDNRRASEESSKRRKISSPSDEIESPTSTDETLSAPPCLVTFSPGVRISAVAAGGRHTLALSGKYFHLPGLQPLSDVGQVWGWGYGGEGQLGLGSRIKLVSSPHVIPCIESTTYVKDRSPMAHRDGMNSATKVAKVTGSYIKGIACGGRHSVAITDAGELLTFGWGLYGQSGHGSTNDVLKPTCVTSLLGIEVKGIAAGLWHTLCITTEGRMYAFGGNQFGQLGTGDDQAETLPRLLDAPNLECNRAKIVSCGCRHSAILTEDGKVFCWGWNKYGQLGLGDSMDRNIPSQVCTEGFLPKNIACGWWHTLLVAEASSM